MRRRLDSWLVRSGAPDWKTYFDRVRIDEKERTRFRDYITINVSAFFRDPERWKSLAEMVLPRLLKESLGRVGSENGLRIWSAGCSIGAEPYTLAILLDEMAPRRRHSILATDYDLGALNKARQGGPYTAEEIQNLTPAQRCLSPTWWSSLLRNPKSNQEDHLSGTQSVCRSLPKRPGSNCLSECGHLFHGCCQRKIVSSFPRCFASGGSSLRRRNGNYPPSTNLRFTQCGDFVL